MRQPRRGNASFFRFFPVSANLRSRGAAAQTLSQRTQRRTACIRFSALYASSARGKAKAPGRSAELMLTAVTELESLSEQMDKPAVYASLVHAAKTDDPRHGALLSRTREQRTAINKHLIFFDLEWVKLPDEPARAVIDSPLLGKYRHYLEQKRAWRPNYPSEPEEKILDEKSVTGRAAFVRLFDETVPSIKYPYEHAGQSEQLSLQQINAKLYDADRSVRQAAATGLTRGLQENARLLTFIFN